VDAGFPVMSICSYVGPAPVTLELYTMMLVSQVRSRAATTRESLEQTLSHLVLPEAVKRISVWWSARGAACS